MFRLAGVLRLQKGKHRPWDVFQQQRTPKQTKIDHVWVLADLKDKEYVLDVRSAHAVANFGEPTFPFCDPTVVPHASPDLLLRLALPVYLLGPATDARGNLRR